MNEKRTELEEAVRSLIEEGRGRVGPEPTEEELWAYHRGDLSAEEADRFEERLAHYPDSVRLLAAFTGEEPAPGDPDFLPEEEQARAWGELETRLDGSRREGEPAASALQDPAPACLPAYARRRRVLPVLERIAAVGLVLVLGALWLVQRERSEELSRRVDELHGPQVIGEERLIALDASRRGPRDGRTLRLPPRTDAYHLTLALYEAPIFPEYRLEIVPEGRPQARPLWSRSGLRRQPDDTFSLYLPGDFLPPGRYELRLYGLEDGSERLLASYPLEV